MKPLPKLKSGSTGFTNDAGQWVCTGSQMGRRDILPENKQANGKLRLVRLRWVSGDYDEGGAYWGGGNVAVMRAGVTAKVSRDYIYRAHGDMDGEEFTTELFVRAKGRLEAKELILAKLPNARFYN